MRNVNAKSIFSGTDSCLFMDDEYMGEAVSLEAKCKKNFEDVQLCENPTKQKRFISAEITGTIKFHKVDSRILKAETTALNEGKQATYTVNSKSYNKNTGKTERITLYDVEIEEFDVGSWEAGKLTDREYPFHASGYSPIEYAD